MLDGGEGASLTLVAAPAGYGKTTAVRSWCASVDAALAWLTVDDGDNDPVRFWRYLATAVDRVRAGIGRTALQRLSVPESPLEDAVDELMAGIAAFGGPLTIVLDDLHKIAAEETLSSIDLALAHLPANARMIVITRIDPALGIARLRVGGELAELRAEELAFTAEEAHELLVVLGQVALEADEVGVLVRRTEGWVAALVLAGLWLRTLDDPTRAVHAFGGNNRFVADYLTAEVLDTLDESRRSFLQGAAVLGELTAAFGDAVLERTDSAVQLAELERSNLFVSGLERGGWFRVHALFAEYAQARLDASEPTAVRRLHRRAAEWLMSRGMPLEAVAHASAAEDHALVAQLLDQHHQPLLAGGAGSGRMLLRWVGTLPDDCLAEYPRLAVAAVLAAILAGSTVEQRRYLRVADQANAAQAPHPDPYVTTWALAARAVTISGGVRQAVLDGRRAVELAQESHESAVASALTSALVASARSLFLAGALDEASATALRALEQPDIDRRAPTRAVAHATVALVAVEQRRLASARSHAEKAKEAVARIRSGRSWLGAHACAALGAVLAAEGDLAAAEQELATGEHFFRDEVTTLDRTWLLVLLAGVRVRRGRLDEAAATLGAALEALDELGDSGRVPQLADEVARELERAMTRAQSGELAERPTEAELSVLRLMAADFSMREIGDQLFLSHNTIRSHRHNLYRKLGVHSRPDALARAAAFGLLTQPDSPG